jgi:hypothetical protein
MMTMGADTQDQTLSTPGLMYPMQAAISLQQLHRAVDGGKAQIGAFPSALLKDQLGRQTGSSGTEGRQYRSTLLGEPHAISSKTVHKPL